LNDQDSHDAWKKELKIMGYVFYSIQYTLELENRHEKVDRKLGKISTPTLHLFFPNYYHYKICNIKLHSDSEPKLCKALPAEQFSALLSLFLILLTFIVFIIFVIIIVVVIIIVLRLCKLRNHMHYWWPLTFRQRRCIASNIPMRSGSQSCSSWCYYG
jgi:hypothetical protein